jgi:SAM-dependent methyltransferase
MRDGVRAAESAALNAAPGDCDAQADTLRPTLAAEPTARMLGRCRPVRSGDAQAPRGRGAPEIVVANRRFYDALWRDARLIEPERFNTWPLVRAFAAPAPRRLEVAPGLRPRLPIEGTQFVDISAPALARLRERGANAVLGLVTSIPFPDGAFELVCALDIVEHVDDEDAALAELSRVASPGAALLLSVPLHPSRWNAFDELVGHQRRYEPVRLLDKLAEYGFSVERSAAYGSQPRSSRLLDFGMWFLVHRRRKAMWWYNRVLMPLGVRFQKKLAFRSGMMACDDLDEILLICRKVGHARPMA